MTLDANSTMWRTLLLGVVCTVSFPSMAGSLENLSVLQDDQYPKAFFFRQPEKVNTWEARGYESWARQFNRLMGIEGKVLANELTHITERVSESFRRFKREYPAQLVLNHANGNARDPSYDRERYFDGHWLYYNGARIVRDVPAEAGETEIHVDDPSLFKTNIGRYGSANEDVGIAMLDGHGKPDWHRAEQVRLVSVNVMQNSITVRRGQYGTRPRFFPSGKAYAAAHMHSGPWGESENLLWRYNDSIVCPPDRHGNRAIDVRVAEIKTQFSSAGRLHTFDGIEFDVLRHVPVKGADERGADCNADGIADHCIIDGREVYGIGVVEFMRKLRQELGGDKLILGDGQTENHNRAFSINNGIESEGWPSVRDHTISDWSGGMNRHYFWLQNAHKPAFNYFAHRYEHAQHGNSFPFSTHRLVFAAAAFTDSAVALGMLPEANDVGVRPVWDELIMGVDQRLGWLGRPQTSAIHLADASPDLLQGVFSPVRQAALNRIQLSGDTYCTAVAGKLTCASVKDHISFVLKAIPAPNRSLTVSIRALGSPMDGYPSEVARLMKVTLVDGVSASNRNIGKRRDARGYMSYVNGNSFLSRFFFPDVDRRIVDIRVTIESAEPVTIENITAHAMADAVYRAFAHGLVLANPGLEPFTFDLNEIVPGKSYRRLKGTPSQDTVVNNGKPVSARVTLGKKDALFLVRTN